MIKGSQNGGARDINETSKSNAVWQPADIKQIQSGKPSLVRNLEKTREKCMSWRGSTDYKIFPDASIRTIILCVK